MNLLGQSQNLVRNSECIFFNKGSKFGPQSGVPMAISWTILDPIELVICFRILFLCGMLVSFKYIDIRNMLTQIKPA